MKRYLLSVALMAAMVLTGCKGHNEVEEPVEGQEITLSFSMASEVQLPDNAAAAPARATTLPGDPGKDDFVAPKYLYFVVWAQTGDQKLMAAVKETIAAPQTDWTGDGKGIYTLNKTKYSYKLILPKDGVNVQTLKGGVFHVFAFASTQDLSSVVTATGLSFGAYTPDPITKGQLVTNTTVTLDALEALTYSIPASVTTGTALEVQEKKSAFFRSMYSTALSETDHNQMATSPTIRLRHTAARLDINWECPTATTGLPKDQTSPLTANSTWTIATASFPTSFSLFKPGENTATPSPTTWSETITIDEGMRYNGRYVTYLPMPIAAGDPAKVSFTVTSSADTINSKGADAEAKKTKTLALTPGSNVNYATWLRALWTIK